MSARRQYAVQRPNGGQWQTLALVDELSQGREQYRAAVQAHGRGYVRLVQVDFHADDALADYDWKVIALHDPRKDAIPRPRRRSGRPAVAARPKARGEKLIVPWALWGLAVVAGLVAAMLWVWVVRPALMPAGTPAGAPASALSAW